MIEVQLYILWTMFVCTCLVIYKIDSRLTKMLDKLEKEQDR